jgi:hypothetical protein
MHVTRRALLVAAVRRRRDRGAARKRVSPDNASLSATRVADTTEPRTARAAATQRAACAAATQRAARAAVRSFSRRTGTRAQKGDGHSKSQDKKSATAHHQRFCAFSVVDEWQSRRNCNFCPPAPLSSLHSRRTREHNWHSATGFAQCAYCVACMHGVGKQSGCSNWLGSPRALRSRRAPRRSWPLGQARCRLRKNQRNPFWHSAADRALDVARLLVGSATLAFELTERTNSGAAATR